MLQLVHAACTNSFIGVSVGANWAASLSHQQVELPTPCFALQVDLRRCVKVDQRQFLNDHFDLSGNACVSLYDNILALTSVSTYCGTACVGGGCLCLSYKGTP